MGYRGDRSWSDLMVDEIRAIVGPHLLRTTPFLMDAKEAADFYVFKAKDMTVAARVRRPGYADRYPFEVTMRSARDSGTKTELSKIIDGWGDWFFYGHATAENTIDRWWLVDLASFRAGLIRHSLAENALVFHRKANGDGTHFVSYDLRSFPGHPPILVGSSHDLPKCREAA